MLPKSATDSHFHIFESPDRYPYIADVRYPPPLAPLDEYLKLAKRDGIERMVFVQPSAYGTDNSCMLDGMKRVGPRARGVIALDPALGMSALHGLDGRGVRGVRVNVSPYQGYDAALPARVAAEAEQTARRIAGLGWHLDFLAPGWLIAELLPVLRALPVDFSVAHMGLFPAAGGVGQPGFRAFLELLREGRAWAKITGLYRLSEDPGFEDVGPIARAVIAANPDRVLWGSDWPHISFADRVSNAQLLEYLRDWADDEATLRKILVDNPARLYGF